MDFIVSCRTAVCGHAFCHECITESLIRKKECPNCRKDIRKLGLSKSEIVDDAVKLIVQSRIEDGKENEVTRWQERMKNYIIWQNNHKLNNVKPGQIIDALDTEFIWCQAVVDLKIKTAE